MISMICMSGYFRASVTTARSYQNFNHFCINLAPATYVAICEEEGGKPSLVFVELRERIWWYEANFETFLRF